MGKQESKATEKRNMEALFQGVYVPPAYKENNHTRATKHFAAAKGFINDAQTLKSIKSKIKKFPYGKALTDLEFTITNLRYLDSDEHDIPNQKGTDVLKDIGFYLPLTVEQKTELKSMRDRGRFKEAIAALDDSVRTLKEARHKKLI